MSNVIKLKRGLDIQLKGKAELIQANSTPADTYAIKPTDFPGLTPKLTVKEGQTVKAGSPLFYDKYSPEVQYVSPVSGEVVAINRGERRRILEVVVKADKELTFEEFAKATPGSLSADQIKDQLTKSGVWPFVKMRPYGVVAKPSDSPKNIFISCFDSSPLAADIDFVLKDSLKDFQTGIDALAKLTSGKVYLGTSARKGKSFASSINGVEVVSFDGAHPAGNVGIQIHHIEPINKGDIVWTVQAQDVAIIGKTFTTGKFDATRTIALAGSEVAKPCYYTTRIGASLSTLVSKENLNSDNVRVISGNVLTGHNVGKDGNLGFYHNEVSVLPEGNYSEMFGWALPGLGKFSPSRAFFSWMGSKTKQFSLDTNFHGEERAFVVSGEYEKVLPMDILPVQLLKATLVNDIDRMEALGIYEIVEEDLALCEYACTSKIEVQDILRKGINTMIKELG